VLFLQVVAALTNLIALWEGFVWGGYEKSSIEHPDEQDRQKLSRFAYEDIWKNSPICAPGQDMQKNSVYYIVMLKNIA
jgi:hypothetical protein